MKERSKILVYCAPNISLRMEISKCVLVYLSRRVGITVFKATFNNISVISWQSVLMVEETRVHGENHRPTTSHWQTLSHNVILSSPRLSGVRTHNVSGDRHYWTGNYKFTYHTITSTTVPLQKSELVMYMGIRGINFATVFGIIE